MDPSSPQHPSQDSPRPTQNLSAGSRASLSHRPASRKQSSDSTSNNKNAPIPDDEHVADMPLTMSASVVLTSLPRDAHQALADAKAVDKGKGKRRPVDKHNSLSVNNNLMIIGLSYLFVISTFRYT